MAIERQDFVFKCNLEGAGNSGSHPLTFSGAVRTAWWSPYDNIKDLAKLDNITLQANGDKVTVSYKGSGQPMITRIMVYADVGK